MKKFLVFLMFALAAMGFTGCFGEKDDDFKSNVTWSNNSNMDVQDITWGDGTSVNAAWNETVNTNGDTSAAKEVSLQTGKGECIDTATSPTEYEIQINNSSNTAYTLADTSAQTLSITGLAKKK